MAKLNGNLQELSNYMETHGGEIINGILWDEEIGKVGSVIIRGDLWEQ